MSTIHETIYTLEEFNKWRRGNKTTSAPEPFELGVAIGDAVRLLRELFVMQARAEKAEAELKEMQSSALTWARFSGEKASCADLAEQRLEKAEFELARLNDEVERLKKDNLDMGHWIGSKMYEPEWNSFKKSLEVIDHWQARAEKAEAALQILNTRS